MHWAWCDLRLCRHGDNTSCKHAASKPHTASPTIKAAFSVHGLIGLPERSSVDQQTFMTLARLSPSMLADQSCSRTRRPRQRPLRYRASKTAARVRQLSCCNLEVKCNSLCDTSGSFNANEIDWTGTGEKKGWDVSSPIFRTWRDGRRLSIKQTTSNEAPRGHGLPVQIAHIQSGDEGAANVGVGRRYAQSLAEHDQGIPLSYKKGRQVWVPPKQGV